MLLCVPAQSFAQAVYGQISGTVTDKQGGVIPNAKVTVTDLAKGTSDTTTSNESGFWTVSHLIPDTYSVTIEAQGFSTVETKDVRVSADTISKFDASLSPGAVTQAVEVTAEAPQLKTERADVATIFNERSVEQLPIFNRNFTNFLLLSPGTTKIGWSHASSENPQGSQQIFVNGQQFAGTGYELDGTDNQDPILGIIIVNPNLDAVTETKITSQNFNAEFGKAIAGIVATQTKSGSNSFHGSAFEFRRSDVFQARDPFANSMPDPITHKYLPPTLWNEFGGSIGGPIIKDKLFFFGDYQGQREKTGSSTLLTVPTNLVRSTCLSGGACNLSEYLNGGQGQIYAPGTTTAYAGNIIPANQVSPQAIALLKLLPAPTSGGIQNNFLASGNGVFNRDAYDVRVDNATTQKLHIFGRYSYQKFDLSGANAFGAGGGLGFGPGGFGGQSKTRNHSLAAGFDYALSNSLVTDFRFGFFRYHVMVQPNTFGTSPLTAAGIPGLNLDKTYTSGLAQIQLGAADGGSVSNVGQISDFGEGLGTSRCNCPLTEDEKGVQFANNWTKTLGNHEFKFGADIRYATNLRVPSDSHRSGQLSFSNNYTSGMGASRGLELGTLLLGGVTGFSRYVSTSTNAEEHQYRQFYFAQDTWRVTPKLTFNYGIRFEDYLPEAVNKAGNGSLFNVKDGLFHVAGVGGIPLNMGVDNTLGAWAPRLGVAYQATPTTVVRVGYGRSFDIGVFGSIFGHTVTQNLPVLANQSLSLPNQFASLFSLSQGPPAFTFPAVPANGLLSVPCSSTTGPCSGVTPRARPFRMRLPTLDAYNVSIQKQITRTLSGEVAYVGNKGTHVFAGNNPDINPNEPSTVGYKEGVPRDQRRPLFNAYPSVYPQGFASDVTYFANLASSSYNALQARLEKRFTEGLQFQAHYTWSKAENYDQDYFAIQPHHGLVDFNRKHVFVLSGVYELPFGRGRKYFNNMNRVADWIFGGYQFSPTVTWQSGLPFSVGYSECNKDIDSGPCWAAKTGSVSTSVGSLVTPTSGTPSRTFFQTTSSLANGQSFNGFTRPAPETFGSRNSLFGPRYFNTDLAAAKNFQITERLRAQFRAEIFNLFNHPQLANPNGCIDGGGTCGQITSIAGNIAQMRNIQFGLRLDF